MGVRDVLAAKRVRETHYMLPVADTAEAERRFEDAWRVLLSAQQAGKAEPKTIARLERAVDKAREAYQACFHKLSFRPMDPAEFDALLSEHTNDEDVDWHALAPPLLAACTVDSDLSAEEWAAELASGRWSSADVMGVARAAFDANGRAYTVGVPKG